MSQVDWYLSCLLGNKQGFERKWMTPAIFRGESTGGGLCWGAVVCDNRICICTWVLLALRLLVSSSVFIFRFLAQLSPVSGCFSGRPSFSLLCVRSMCYSPALHVQVRLFYLHCILVLVKLDFLVMTFFYNLMYSPSSLSWCSAPEARLWFMYP